MHKIPEYKWTNYVQKLEVEFMIEKIYLFFLHLAEEKEEDNGNIITGISQAVVPQELGNRGLLMVQERCVIQQLCDGCGISDDNDDDIIYLFVFMILFEFIFLFTLFILCISNYW